MGFKEPRISPIFKLKKGDNGITMGFKDLKMKGFSHQLFSGYIEDMYILYIYINGC